MTGDLDPAGWAALVSSGAAAAVLGGCVVYLWAHGRRRLSLLVLLLAVLVAYFVGGYLLVLGGTVDSASLGRRVFRPVIPLLFGVSALVVVSLVRLVEPRSHVLELAASASEIAQAAARLEQDFADTSDG